MRKVLNDINLAIEECKYAATFNHRLQFIVIDKFDYKEFTQYCNNIAEYVVIDTFKSVTEEFNNRRRLVRTKTSRTFEEFIDVLDNAKTCGIKVYLNSVGSIFDLEYWENGYVEQYVNVILNGEEFIIWQRIKGEHLESILKTFRFRLSYFKLFRPMKGLEKMDEMKRIIRALEQKKLEREALNDSVNINEFLITKRVHEQLISLFDKIMAFGETELLENEDILDELYEEFKKVAKLNNIE